MAAGGLEEADMAGLRPLPATEEHAIAWIRWVQVCLCISAALPLCLCD